MTAVRLWLKRFLHLGVPRYGADRRNGIALERHERDIHRGEPDKRAVPQADATA